MSRDVFSGEKGKQVVLSPSRYILKIIFVHHIGSMAYRKAKGEDYSKV